MTRPLRIFTISISIIMLNLLITVPALAIPPLPSSFYGKVKVNAANVPDGTVIQALIGNQVYAEGFTQTYQGNSVFTLDVPGDDSDTTTVDGGREGDTVQFKIGNILADQTGTWHSGTNIDLDLTASTSEPIDTPQATPTSFPTQTPIVIRQPSQTSTAIAKVVLTPTSLVDPRPTETTLDQQPTISTSEQPLSTSPQSLNDENQDSGDDSQVIKIIIIIVIVLTLAFGASLIIWRLRKRT